MSVKPEGPLKDIKTAVFDHPVKVKHLNFKYLYLHFYYQSSICLLIPKMLLIFRIFEKNQTNQNDGAAQTLNFRA